MANEQKNTNCKVCGQSFNTEQERDQHERNSHPETGRREGGSSTETGENKERKTA